MAREQPKTTDNLVQEIDYERPWLYEKQERGLFNDASISCIEASTKAQPVDATVYTQFGPKDMGDIQVGDKVVGVDGKPTEVVGVYPQGTKRVYKVTFTDGSSTECTSDHLWAVYNEWLDWDDYRLMTLADVREEIPVEEYAYTYIPPHSPVQFMVQNTSDDPYAVGKYLSRYGYVNTEDVELSTGIKEPRIPEEYKYNTVFVREQVLTGLFEQNDGHINLSRVPDSLASDIREVLLSLGASGDDKGTRAFKNIEYIGEKECQCIEVSSSDGLYLTDDFIVTHNSGKTLGALIWLFEQALQGNQNENYWWVAPFSSQADIAWRRMKNMVPNDIYQKNETLKRMELINGTSMWFKSGDNEEGLYGEDVYGVVIDEASRLKRSAWVAIRTTMTYTQGKVRAIGNVRGMQNWFYKLCRRAEASDEERYHYEKITALDAAEAGVIPWPAIVEAKKDLTDDEFKELYLAEPSDDVGNPFGIENIAKCIMTDSEGNPISSPRGGNPVAWGWDLGRHENFTAGVALDADGNVCDMERFKAPYDTMVRRIVNATDGTTAYVDSTGSGDPLLDRIRKEGGENFRSFTFSGKSKPNLMTGLATAIQNREIAIPDGKLRTELEAFEYERKSSGNVVYRSPKGTKDDLVDGLALCVKLWRERTVYPSDVSPLSIGKASSWKM